MYLNEFYDYKNKLVEDIITNETLVHLINEDIGMDESESLVYSQVFPYEYVPETINTDNTIICFDVDIVSTQKRDSRYIYYPVIYIYIMCHKSKLRLPEGGVRMDEICSEIDKTIDGSLHYGLGELKLDYVKRFSPMTNFNGKVMAYNAKDFSRQYEKNRDVPTNRKNDGAIH